MGVLARSGWTVLTLWIFSCLLGYYGLGSYLAESVEGIAAVPLWPSVLFAATVIISIGVTGYWAIHLRRHAAALDQPGPAIASGRRRFITGAAAITGGVVGAGAATAARVGPWMTVTSPALSPRVTLTDPNPKADWDGASIESYRPLGDTGLVVSDIAIGSTRVQNNADPVGYMKNLLDRGVNYIDASPDYAPESEGIIGDAIAGRRRDDLVIASKFCTRAGHLRQGSSVADYVASIEGTLSRLENRLHRCRPCARLRQRRPADG